MWLTGLDVPSLATMYIYKPMMGHNLMQAIARVNRVFKDKEGRLVVDYVGIASALKKAMNEYTSRDKENFGDTDISKASYPKFSEKMSICRDFMHGFDYSSFISGSDLQRAQSISGGVNFLLGKSNTETNLDEKERTQYRFIKEALLIKHSIKSEGIINLFSDTDNAFSLFDSKFLEEIANMKEKNLAVELLKKLIAEQVSVFKRTNVVKSEKFSEMIQSAMNRYLNGMLTNEEGEKLGLTPDELAFYDAITKPQAIIDFYENDQLVAITKELTDMLCQNKTID